MPTNPVVASILQSAKRYNIDPRAAIAVARGEGGLVNREGDIGDLSGGGSYGPFQLYAQGALPSQYRGNSQAADSWAWSPSGIDYAVSRMAKAGAAGLIGPEAVETIIRKFERPADPDTSVRNALARYSSSSGGSNDPMTQAAAQAFQSGPAGIVAGPNPAQLLAFRQRAAQTLLAQGNAGILGQSDVSGQWLIQLAMAKRQLAQANAGFTAAEVSARQYGGTTQPLAVEGGSELQNRVISAATAQLGKPYVWGAESTNEGGFDCSGLIDWAYRQAGVKLPVGRLTTQTALKIGYSVKGKPLTAGDMIVTNGGKHMVMYVGDGQVIAAPRRGEVVQYQPVSRFQGDIVDVRRVLK